MQLLHANLTPSHYAHSQLIVNVPPDPTTLCPPPLEEAVTLDLYQRCISPPPPPPPEEQADEVSA